MDRRVVKAILEFPERDIFLRGVRAFTGFRQTGIDYCRPERMFGTTTNSFLRNLGWAKKGILSFSNVPLNILSAAGFVLLFVTFSLMVIEVALKALLPELAPKGFTSVLLTIGFFGAINLFAVSLIGEYIAKIFEEVKQRPLFIRRSLIKDGEVRLATDKAQNA